MTLSKEASTLPLNSFQVHIPNTDRYMSESLSLCMRLAVGMDTINHVNRILREDNGYFR